MEAFDIIYNDFFQEVSNYFFCLYGNKDITAELTQETFFKVFVSLHTFDEKCSLKTWIFSIAKHTHYQYLSRKRKIDLIEFYQTENFTNQSDTKIVIQSILSKLKEPYKQVVILRSINDLSFRQIAYLMEKTENWTKVTFHRGKILLKELIEKEKLI